LNINRADQIVGLENAPLCNNLNRQSVGTVAGRSPRKSIHWIDFLGSPTPDGVDDFDVVAFADCVLCESAAGNELFVDFHGNAFAGQIESGDEIGDGGVVTHIPGFAIDGNIHR